MLRYGVNGKSNATAIPPSMRMTMALLGSNLIFHMRECGFSVRSGLQSRIRHAHNAGVDGSGNATLVSPFTHITATGVDGSGNATLVSPFTHITATGVDGSGNATVVSPFTHFTATGVDGSGNAGAMSESVNTTIPAILPGIPVYGKCQS
jgi:hypothetical protein